MKVKTGVGLQLLWVSWHASFAQHQEDRYARTLLPSFAAKDAETAGSFLVIPSLMAHKLWQLGSLTRCHGALHARRPGMTPVAIC